MPMLNSECRLSRREIEKRIFRAMELMSSCDEVEGVTRMCHGYSDFFYLIDLASTDDLKEWLEKDPKNLLLAELFIAERLARRGGKRKTMDTHGFEQRLFENLIRLRDAVWEICYSPNRGTIHIIFDPVQREILAAPYVDRILHHWIVVTIIKWQDQRLIYDSYSCRKGKGTWKGIKRLQHHILSVSCNMKRECYVIQLDISGYFMHIKRKLLYMRIKNNLDRQFAKSGKDRRYRLLKWVLEQTIFDDPIDGVRIQGSYEDWRGLAEDKSLMMQLKDQGLVIGNYTSQTFSNVYLDGLDKFIVKTLGWKHYGRYVDDFFIVVTKEELPRALEDIKAIELFLAGYGLRLNKKKTRVTEVHKGIKFLGTVVRGFRIFPGERIVKNFRKAVYEVAVGERDPDVIISYLGMFSHMDAGKIIRNAFVSVGWEYIYDKKREL